MITGQCRKNWVLPLLCGVFFLVLFTLLCLLTFPYIARGADAKTAKPTFQPNPGIYAAPQMVRLSCATPRAVIRYTIDGSQPGASAPIYNGPIAVDRKIIISAYALADGAGPSPVATARYDIVVAAPTFNPPPRTADKPIRVSLFCATPRAIIRYTTDGGNPSETSPVYNGPINIENTATIKAYAVSSTPGPTDSKVVAATYTIQSAKAAAPVFSPPAGSFAHPLIVVISCATPGATIRYTTNGGNPNPTSDIYNGPINVDKSMTIKAYAAANGFSDSAVVTANYKIVLAKADTPKFSPTAGAYPPPLSVAISCATPGATIRYTTDGSNPNESSTQYTGPIPVNQNTTLFKAYASANGYADSMVAAANYKLAQNKAETPTFIPAAGAYSEPQKVAITCGTPGATIRYTTNGSTPNTSSPLYHAPIIVDKNTVVKAYAAANNCADSAVATASYKIVSERVETPKFSPMGGTYAAPQSVMISCATPGATIRYTTDGSNPSTLSTYYNGPIFVDQNKMIKAFAVAKGFADSAVATANYTIKNAPSNTATPTPTPNATNPPPPQGTIIFTTPTANETIMIGSVYSLRWTLQGNPGPIKLLLQESGGYTTTLATNVDATKRQMQWTVTPPPDPYQRYRILTYSADGGNIGSSNYFRFQYPSITVTAPKSGQILQAGIPAAISWTYQPQNGTLKIELVRMSDNQVSDPIASNVKLNQYVIHWPPPTNKPAGFYGQKYKIRITNASLDFYGESEPFTITAPLLSPTLTRAEIIFNTTRDNKEANTAVSVHVTANYMAAWVDNNSGAEYRSNFGYTLPLICDPKATKNDCSNLKVSVGARIPAPYWDSWSFYSTVILYFSDGSQIIKRYPAERVFNLTNGRYDVMDL